MHLQNIRDTPLGRAVKQATEQTPHIGEDWPLDIEDFIMRSLLISHQAMVEVDFEERDINGALEWRDSPQGTDFWETLYLHYF
jgi:hypothetical protein